MNPQAMPSSIPELPAARRRWWWLPRPIAWVVLLILLAASAGGWAIARKHAEAEARRQFEEEAGWITAAFTERMQIYEDVLHGAAGLFAASVSVERLEWRTYLESVSIERRFPGIDGVGYVARVPRGNLDGFLRAARADKAPDFQVKEAGTNGDLLLVKYLEPEARHRDILGRDISPHPVQRAAAERARDTGLATLSAVVGLRYEGREPQPGFLMVLPVYRHGPFPPTVEARQEAIEGWVFARFLTAQLMTAVLKDKYPGIHLRIRDVDAQATDDLVFDNDPGLTARRPVEAAWFSHAVHTRFGGRTWAMSFRTKPAFEASARRRAGLPAGGLGLLISLLVFGIAWSLSHTRERAVAMAADMTRTLRATNDRLQLEIHEREQAKRRTAAQHAVTRVLAEAATLPEATAKIVQAICESLGWEVGALWLRSPGTDQLQCVEFWHRPDFAVAEFEEDSRRRTFAKGVGLPGRVWSTRRPVWIPDVLREQNFPRAPFAARAGLHAAFGFPIVLGNELLGVIEFFSRETSEPDDGLLSMMTAAGSQIGQFIERKRSEEALRHSEAIYHSLVESLPLAIVRKDLQGRLTFANTRYCAYLGKPLADLVGRGDPDLFPPEVAARQRLADQQVLETGATLETVEERVESDGNRRYIQVIRTPVYESETTIIGLLGILWDVTDRKRAEEALRQAKEAAEDANQTKSHFLASMSHELRTPLNSVIGFANILIKNKAGALGPAELNFLERIQANGKHLLSLINQILDLSKIEARKIELQTGPVALDELVRGTLAQQEGLAPDKPVQLLAEVPAVVAPIVTDADKLRQVLINLVGNALKFTEQGSVKVRIVTDRADNRPVRLEVIDTGIGIPKEKLAVIFEPFQQAEAGTARRYGGTGLGLTISRALCQLMGHRLTVDSQPGHGSTFSIHLGDWAGAELPKTPVPGWPPAVPPATPGALAGKLVLVIDDELDSRTLLMHAIEEFGCRAIAAPSGEEGLRLARDLQPQLITVDLMMPQLDGWQVISALKADPALCDIPVAVVSIVGSEHRGRILGVVDVLQKPFNRPDLLAVLNRCLPVTNPRILVIDDEADARRLLASHLEEEPCEVRLATGGREALEILDGYTPDLILLDLMMPGMDGMTFLNHLRATPKFQFLPVVIVTAKDLTVAESDQLQRLAQSIIRKGDVFEGDLRTVLHRLLHLGPAAKQTSPS